jgi:hypothetical protein
MRTFGQYIEHIFNEADAPPAGGGSPPPGGGGMPPPGGPPALPPPSGGGMPPMGGPPPMGGAAGAPTGAKPAQKVKTHNVWSELEKLLNNK